MSDAISWVIAPSDHREVRVPTGVSISQAQDGSTTVTESGFVGQCGLCGTDWPCMIARLAAMTERAERAEALAARLEEIGGRLLTYIVRSHGSGAPGKPAWGDVLEAGLQASMDWDAAVKAAAAERMVTEEPA